ncbi:MAG TPA: MltA domain-containing protein, partial [Oligoflexia bacterium]|nr:MltA domain-containing protein [Oligoflexia bacterium]
MNLPSYFNSQLFILAVALICSACGHKPFDKAVREFSDPRILALEKTAPPSPEDFADDLNYKSLPRALESSIQVLKSRPDATLMFGDREISAQHYAEALNNFSTFLQNAADANLSEQTVYKYVIENFDFYQVYGDRAPSQIFMTSYFEPVIEGSLRRTKRFSQPIYSRPADLLELDVAAFDEGLAPPRKYRARVENGKVVPYYSRREIDIDMALAKKKLELLWVDPIDSFIAQIQGSATVVLPSGKQVRINYAERNGHKYEALGKFLKAH